MSDVSKDIRERFSKRRSEVEAGIERFREKNGREPSACEIHVITRETRGVKLREITTPEVRKGLEAAQRKAIYLAPTTSAVDALRKYGFTVAATVDDFLMNRKMNRKNKRIFVYTLRMSGALPSMMKHPGKFRGSHQAISEYRQDILRRYSLFGTCRSVIFFQGTARIHALSPGCKTRRSRTSGRDTKTK